MTITMTTRSFVLYMMDALTHVYTTITYRQWLFPVVAFGVADVYSKYMRISLL
jgi:hypothetical protein